MNSRIRLSLVLPANHTFGYQLLGLLSQTVWLILRLRYVFGFLLLVPLSSKIKR